VWALQVVSLPSTRLPSHRDRQRFYNSKLMVQHDSFGVDTNIGSLGAMPEMSSKGIYQVRSEEQYQ